MLEIEALSLPKELKIDILLEKDNNTKNKFLSFIYNYHPIIEINHFFIFFFTTVPHSYPWFIGSALKILQIHFISLAIMALQH